MKALIILCVLLSSEYMVFSLEIGISKGAVIEEVRNVVLYSEEQYLHFLIPDLPDLPVVLKKLCSSEDDPDICNLTTTLTEINRDSSKLLLLLNKFMTKKGLDDEELFNDDPQEGNGETTDNLEDDINLGGGRWNTWLQGRLLQRKITSNGGLPLSGNMHTRRRRVAAVIPTILKGVTAVAAAFGVDDLFGAFKNVFVGEDKIFAILSTLKSYLPVSRQAFAMLSKKASEFEVESRKMFAEVMQDASKIQDITKKLEDEISKHAFDIMTVEHGYTKVQEVMGDTVTILFSAILYLLHTFAFQDCRTKYLPMTYVPPRLLSDSLNELQSKLGDDVRLAIGVDRVQAYYSLNNMASCIFDNEGGLVRLMVPLIPKKSFFQLYQVKPIQFGWKSHTCSIDLGPSFAIKEQHSEMVYPVTDVDEEYCQPNIEGKCKVPSSTADDVGSACVSLILSGASTEIIKQGCSMKCVKDDKTEVSKLNDDVFVVVHPPVEGLEVVCPNTKQSISEPIEYGVLRIKIGCDCFIAHNGKEVGRSTQKVCNDAMPLQIDVLIPSHFTTLDDFVPWSDESASSITKFHNVDEIFNNDFENEVINPPEDEELFTTQIPIYSFMWNGLQTLLIAYSFFKMNLLGGAVLNLASALPMAEAALDGPYTCKIPYELYALLLSILLLAVIAVVPQIFCCAYSSLKKLFRQSVEIEAKKQNQMQEL